MQEGERADALCWLQLTLSKNGDDLTDSRFSPVL